MAATYEITELTEYYPNPHTPCWLVETRRSDDGNLHRHIFPKATLAYRAAEYGIDPADTDTLVDIVLHEPFAPSPDDPYTAADDPAPAAGLLSPATAARGTAAVGDLVPTTLANAKTIEKAREAHLLRIQYAKTHVAKVTSPKGKPDPLAPIRSSTVDRDLVARHTAWVAERRAHIRGEGRTPRPDIVLDTTTADRRKETTRA